MVPGHVAAVPSTLPLIGPDLCDSKGERETLPSNDMGPTYVDAHMTMGRAGGVKILEWCPLFSLLRSSGVVVNETAADEDNGSTTSRPCTVKRVEYEGGIVGLA